MACSKQAYWVGRWGQLIFGYKWTAPTAETKRLQSARVTLFYPFVECGVVNNDDHGDEDVNDDEDDSDDDDDDDAATNKSEQNIFHRFWVTWLYLDWWYLKDLFIRKQITSAPQSK